MTHYREILRLGSNPDQQRNLTQEEIAASCGVSKTTVNKVLKRARELELHWPLPAGQTDEVLAAKLFPEDAEKQPLSTKRMPDCEKVRKELLRSGVTKKLLWTEYLEECRAANEVPLMYSQFCYYIQQDEQKRRASMHVPHTPGEEVQVDWAGDPFYLTDAASGKKVKAYVFVAVLPYSEYAYAEAFPDEKSPSWIRAHVHLYAFLGGVPKITVPDNCKTAVVHNPKREDPEINRLYHQMAEHYGTAILPARVLTPRDKGAVEGVVGNISTWIIAAMRDEKCVTIQEANRRIRKKLDEFNRKPFTKRERVTGTNSSVTKNSLFWLPYPLPRLNWQTGKQPPSSTIITFPSRECYIRYLSHISAKWSMCG